MERDRYDSFSYDDDWQVASKPEQYSYVAPKNKFETAITEIEEEYDSDIQDMQGGQEPRFVKRTKKNKPWLIIVQLVLAILIFVAALLLKETKLDIYETLKTWYQAELSNSIIITENLKDITSLLDNSAKANEN